MDPRINFLFFFTALLPGVLLAQQSAKRTDHEYSVGYLEYLPPGYETGGKFPLMIFLHGGGEKGDGTPESLERVKSWGPPSLIAGGHDMCFTVDGQKECFIVLSPQLNPDLFDWPTTVVQLMDYIQRTPENYKIDPDRIYITGLSRGGLGVYQYAASYHNRINRLAAIAPISAWSENTSEGCIISKRKISVWAFHGRQDTVVPYRIGLAAFNRINNCIDPVPGADLIFTTYDDRYHDAWIPAYEPSHTHHTPNLYEWLLHQKLQPPDPVTAVSSGAMEDAFSIYPNPATDVIFLSFPVKSPSRSTVKILNLTGEQVIESNMTQRINVAALPAGMYILHAENDSGVIAIRRFTKVK